MSQPRLVPCKSKEMLHSSQPAVAGSLAKSVTQLQKGTYQYHDCSSHRRTNSRSSGGSKGRRSKRTHEKHQSRNVSQDRVPQGVRIQAAGSSKEVTPQRSGADKKRYISSSAASENVPHNKNSVGSIPTAEKHSSRRKKLTAQNQVRRQRQRE